MSKHSVEDYERNVSPPARLPWRIDNPAGTALHRVRDNDGKFIHLDYPGQMKGIVAMTQLLPIAGHLLSNARFSDAELCEARDGWMSSYRKMIGVAE